MKVRPIMAGAKPYYINSAHEDGFKPNFNDIPETGFGKTVSF